MGVSDSVDLVSFVRAGLGLLHECPMSVPYERPIRGSKAGFGSHEGHEVHEGSTDLRFATALRVRVGGSAVAGQQVCAGHGAGVMKLPFPKTESMTASNCLFVSQLHTDPIPLSVLGAPHQRLISTSKAGLGTTKGTKLTKRARIFASRRRWGSASGVALWLDSKSLPGIMPES